MPPSTSFSSLAPELHHHIVGALSPTHADGGSYGLSRYSQREVIPDLKTIASLSRTCVALYNNVNWMLFEACRAHTLLSKRAIYHAVSSSQPELLTKLASAGAAFDVDIPLSASWSSQPYTIHSNLWRGSGAVDDADLEELDDELQVRPLHIAASKGDLVIVRKLLDIYGPTQAAAEVYNYRHTWSPLDMAILRRDLEIVRLFTSASLRERTRSKTVSGRALIVASGLPPAEGLQVMKILIEENGVDVNFSLRRWGTLPASPIESALAANNLDSLRLLLEHGANTETRLRYREWYELPEDILPALPLHLAVKNGDIQLATLLLDAGADINAKDDHALGVLTYAVLGSGARGGAKQMCRFLIAAGARVSTDYVGRFRTSSLDMVMSRCNDGELLRLLVEAEGGAATLNDGTVLDFAMARRPDSDPQTTKIVREVLLPHVKSPKRRKEVEAWLGKRYGRWWIRRQFVECFYACTTLFSGILAKFRNT